MSTTYKSTQATEVPADNSMLVKRKIKIKSPHVAR